MKKLLLSLFVLLLLGSITLEAQKQSFHALSAKFLFVDYGTANSIDDLDITNGIELGYTAGLNKYLGLAVPIKIGSADSPNRRLNRFFGQMPPSALYCGILGCKAFDAAAAGGKRSHISVHLA